MQPAGLGAGKLTGQLFDGDAHQTGLLERGHVIGIGEGTEHANDPLAGLELGRDAVWIITESHESAVYIDTLEPLSHMKRLSVIR